jgi:hypothetical protein
VAPSTVSGAARRSARTAAARTTSYAMRRSRPTGSSRAPDGSGVRWNRPARLGGCPCARRSPPAGPESVVPAVRRRPSWQRHDAGVEEAHPTVNLEGPDLPEVRRPLKLARAGTRIAGPSSQEAQGRTCTGRPSAWASARLEPGRSGVGRARLDPHDHQPPGLLEEDVEAVLRDRAVRLDRHRHVARQPQSAARPIDHRARHRLSEEPRRLGHDFRPCATASQRRHDGARDGATEVHQKERRTGQRAAARRWRGGGGGRRAPSPPRRIVLDRAAPRDERPVPRAPGRGLLRPRGSGGHFGAAAGALEIVGGEDVGRRARRRARCW